MKKYLLLGAYNPTNPKDNITIIQASDDVNELKDIWKTINEFHFEMEESFDGALSIKALKLIEENSYLNKLFELFHDTILWTIDIFGIYEAVKTKPVCSD